MFTVNIHQVIGVFLLPIQRYTCLLSVTQTGQVLSHLSAFPLRCSLEILPPFICWLTSSSSLNSTSTVLYRGPNIQKSPSLTSQIL